MYANPTKRKRQQRQHENDINSNKQKMNKNNSMIDAHQFDIAVEAVLTTKGDWTDEHLSLWAALDHLDTNNNNNNNNEIITPQQHQQHHQRRLSGLGVGVSPPNKNKSYAGQQALTTPRRISPTAVSNLPATTQANAVGAPTSGTTIIHHHHHYPSNGSNKNSINGDKEQGSLSSIVKR